MRKFWIALTFPLTLIACGGGGLEVESESVDPNEVNNIDQDIIDGGMSMTTTVGGKMFSIPSPVQMSLLLKDVYPPIEALV